MAKPPTFTSTLTEVCNLSLAMIGSSPDQYLDDIDTDTGQIATVCRQFLYVTIRDVQSEFRWEELTSRVTLTTPQDITEDLNYKWGYRYLLPDDYLIPIWWDDSDHEIEAGYVYCNTEDNYVFNYIAYSILVDDWSSQLLITIKQRLAMALCLPLIEDDGKYEALLNEYERVILPRATRLSSYGKKVPNIRKRVGNWSRTRGRV